MKKYDSSLRIVSADGKTARITAGTSRRSYTVDLAEWPAARKNNVLLRPASVSACALCWSIRKRFSSALRIPATFGQPFDITLPLSSSEVERRLPLFRERAAWVELCTRKTRLTLDLPRGKYAVIDPCFLDGVKEGDTLGTAFDVRPLSCGGYSWRMFGDGAYVESGTLCIVPADRVPEAEAENVYGWYSAADRIMFDCVRVSGTRKLNVNIRWGADKPQPSFTNIRPYGAPFIALY